MEEETIKLAEKAYIEHHYKDALMYYKKVQNAGVTLSDEQLYRYSKSLSTCGETLAALKQAEQISSTGLENFDSIALLYRLKKQTGSPYEELIQLLVDICKISYDGELMIELAQNYIKIGSIAKCKRICKQIINFFHSGEYVDKAYELLKSSETAATNIVNAEPIPVETNTANNRKEDKPTPDDTPDFLKEAFAGIVGMDSVKKELKKFYDHARIEKLRADNLGLSTNEERAYNFILYGNPGTGKTTVARIIGKVLFALDIRKNDSFIEVDRSKLVADFIGGTAKLTKSAIADANGGTLFIDEAYSLYKKDSSRDFGQEAIDTLLKDMEDNRSEYSVIMAGYREQMTEMLNNSNPGFRSRFNYHIDIPDYTDNELIQIAHSITNKHQYLIDAAGDEAIRKRIAKERIDDTFGNARFIRELINEAEINMSGRLSKAKTFLKKDLYTLIAEDICPPDENAIGLNELLEQLDHLTGLAGVKNHVRELKDKIMVQKEAELRGISIGSTPTSMHMTFKGNAGTGKTTVARLIGRIFGELGVLKRGNVFVECTREDVVGKYQGQTAAKMKEVIQSAMGGVLFIDEAYSLKNGPGDTFGQEAINTLVAAMENHRDSLVVILAGYTTDIDNFLQTNQGLRSRIKHDLFFDDYTPDEMAEIFYSLAHGNNLNVSEELYPKVTSLLEQKSNGSDFGNGRGVRNVYEAVVTKKDSRIAKMLSSNVELQDAVFSTILDVDLAGV